MGDFAYKVFVMALDWLYWDGELMGEEHLPETGPAVLIANHLGPLGPIGAVCSIPRRLYSWIVADMVDPRLAPDYLRWDFVEKSLHLKMPLSLKVATALSKITVPLLRSIGCVPVYKGDYDYLQTTLKLSLDLLLRGEFLMIFPEDNTGPVDERTHMQPFLKSFARLGEMYYHETRRPLRFYPVAVHPSHAVQIGPPVTHNPLAPHPAERLRIKNAMETAVREMYLALDREFELRSGLVPQSK